jgi:hypothetical protein
MNRAARVQFLAVMLAIAAFLAPAAALATDPLSFVQTEELSTPNGLGTDFGSAVAVDADTMVVAAPRDYLDPMDDCGYGVAYVYTRQPGSPFWDLIAHLRGDDHGGPEFNCFGYWNPHVSAAIKGDTIAIGVPEMTNESFLPYGEMQGRVYVFNKHGGAWQDATEDQMLYSRIAPPDADHHIDNFGSAVAFAEDGRTLVVGARGAFVGSGAAYVYESDVLGHWTESALLTPNDAIAYGAFGASVGISGRTIVVGNERDSSGLVPPYRHVAVFEEPADGWQDATPTFELSTQIDNSSYSVGIDGETIIVGGFDRLDDNGTPIGLSSTGVFIFERQVDGGWDETAQLVPGDGGGYPVGQNGYGAVVAIKGETAVVSAPFGGTEPGDVGEGAAYVFRRTGAAWGDPGNPSVIGESQKLVGENARGGVNFDEAGWDISLDGPTIAVAAPFRTQLVIGDGCPECHGLDSGGVFVYGQTTDTTAPTTSIVREPAAPSGSNGWDRLTPDLNVSATDDPSGSGVFEIRCQLDGNTPYTFDQMAEGCAYAGGATYTKQGLHTLYAASVDSAGNRSSVVSIPLKLDTLPPVSDITLSPATPDQPDGSYSVPVTVSLSMEPDANSSLMASAHCAVNPAAPPATYDDLPVCPTYFFYPGLEYQASGDYTMWVALLDDAGNKETPHSQSFSLHIGPTTTIGLTPATADGTNGWYKSAVTASVTATTVGTAHVVGLRCILDPAVAPATFNDIPSTCPYAQGGARITTNGRHTLYAASRDDHNNTSAVVTRQVNIDGVAPTVTCDGNGPASFLIGEPDGTVTATVADSLSGPAANSVSADLVDTDLDIVGNRTKVLTGTDVAGNTATANCAYSVGYDVGVNTPADGAKFKAGTSITIAFTLSDADGAAISDATAAVLIGGKKKPCFIAGLYDGVAQTGCATYNAATDTFSVVIKTPKSRSVLGGHQIGLQIKAPNGSGIINVQLIPIVLT